MDFQDIARRIRLGDQNALRELVSAYGPSVYEKAYARTQDRDLAREATRQTFKQLVAILRDDEKADGWELLLLAVARRNIDAYSQIPSEMRLIGHQLEHELFTEQCNGAASPATSAAHVRAQPVGAAFSAEIPSARAGEHPPAYPPATQPAQAAAQPQAFARPPVQQDPVTQREHARARVPASDTTVRDRSRRGARKQADADELFDETIPRHTAGGAFAVILLVLLCAALLWIVAGVVLSLLGYGQSELAVKLGYEWFRQTFPQIALF